MEYISPELRYGFREFCVGLYVAQIEDIFRAVGVKLSSEGPTMPISGERRTCVEKHYAAMDWSSKADARKFLQAISLVLSQTYLAEEVKEPLRELCRREGLIVESRSVRFADSLDADWLVGAGGRFDRSLFAKYLERMQQAVYTDPEAAVGASKELVEAVAKYVLKCKGKVAGKEDLSKLVKSAASELALSTDDIPNSIKGAESIKRILAALNQIVSGMAELRNLYGTGHGRPASLRTVKPRHAKLAVGAAITLTTFLLETMEDRDSTAAAT